MKKILIVNNNMKIGGVQKSLYNLLWETAESYEITLALFRAVGDYAAQLPPNVKILECESLFRYLGISQAECGTARDRLIRGILAGFSRVFGRSAVMKLLCLTQKPLPETYDCAISFLHNGRPEAFYGGTQDFVLNRVRAKTKVAFLHGDYRNCGANHPRNNRMLARFDKIAACSDGCRKALEETLPELAEKCVTVRNFHRFDEIRSLADQDPVRYVGNCVNVVMVSRLSHEKGIDRAITALMNAAGKGIPAMLHIVGDGPEAEALRTLTKELAMEDRVVFYGQQENPYRFMKNADLFLMTSYHEAAPMVIEEARCLGLPVLTTRTTSSEEMVTERNAGWVCDNSQEALEEMLHKVLSDGKSLSAVRNNLQAQNADNEEAESQFFRLLEEEL